MNATASRVTSDNVKATAKHYLDPKHLVLGVMKPKPEPAKK